MREAVDGDEVSITRETAKKTMPMIISLVVIGVAVVVFVGACGCTGYYAYACSLHLLFSFSLSFNVETLWVF